MKFNKRSVWVGAEGVRNKMVVETLGGFVSTNANMENLFGKGNNI